jgi:transcription initiation factor TFIIIB Brf1 subunit/transcription initiation factor TFIIB
MLKKKSLGFILKLCREDLSEVIATEAVVAGVVYAVLRMYDIPRTLNEVSEVTGIDKKKVAKNFKYVSQET